MWNKRVAASVLTVIACAIAIPFAALSEPYKIAFGDTLGKIATDHGVTLAALKAANPDIANANDIKVGQAIVIPEGATVTPTPEGGVKAAPARKESRDVAILRKGIEDQKWVVTRNSEGTLFVHRSESGGMLTDMRYVIKEKQDAASGETTWTLYRPDDRNARVGVMQKMDDVPIGECGCQ